MFPPNSRYANIDVATIETADRRTVAYLRRRFVPSSPGMSIVAEHVLTEGDRLDNLAARYLGDPEQFWRLCDANNALRPDDLIEVGRRLRIAMPQAG
jgi:nucleoid-associated protein YgaU